MKKLLAILFVLAAGCDQLEIKDDKGDGGTDNSFEKSRRIESSALEDNIKIDVKGADPEKYAVQFSWPYLQDGKILRIRLGSVLSEVQPKQTYYTHILDHAQTVTYSFDILDSSRRPERTFTKSVVVPRDFVARAENSNISDNTRIEVNRLYLSDDSPLTTNGKNLDIVTNELHAEKGFIQGFPEKVKIREIDGDQETTKEIPPTADKFKQGSSGGNLSISAKKLYGKLKVVMRGQNGGEGLKGDPTAGRGATGSAAGYGNVECYPDCTMETCLVKPNELILPLMKPGGTCGCTSTGHPGGQGSKGNKGLPGKQGMPGGDSGNVKVSIQQYVPLEGYDPSLPQDDTSVVKVELIPGKGGSGGAGGDGQLGGEGGPGEPRPSEGNGCKGTNGPEGPKGDSGDIGPIGVDGKAGLKCIYVGSENINECVQ